MSENERPQTDEPTSAGDEPNQAALDEAIPAGEPLAEPVSDTVDAATEAAAQAAAEAEAALESLAQTAAEAKASAASARRTARLAVTGQPDPEPQNFSEETTTVMDHLTQESEYDSAATSDDKLLAALSYASQLFIPVLVPLILLVSETSKKRPYQKYHAVQSLALGIVIWVAEVALMILATIATATVIGILCLCFIVPAMIVLWLLPLYYAILAYGGQRFTIPGLTQFLQDQQWL